MLLRHEMGDVLREHRKAQGRTLRQVAAESAVSLGYLSEVERGIKEPSSELLDAICVALDVSLAAVLRDIAARYDACEEVAETIVLPMVSADGVTASAA